MRLRAVVCEARPLCEGVQLAAAWAEAGVECQLITDAQVGCLGGDQGLQAVSAAAGRDAGHRFQCSCWLGFLWPAQLHAARAPPSASYRAGCGVNRPAPTLAGSKGASPTVCPLPFALQAGLFVGQADLVLLGADAFTATAAVNKSGSYLLALAAQAAGVPVYVAADTSKLSPGPLFSLAHPGGVAEEEHEEKEAEEVTAAWGRPVPQG